MPQRVAAKHLDAYDHQVSSCVLRFRDPIELGSDGFVGASEELGHQSGFAAEDAVESASRRPSFGGNASNRETGPTLVTDQFFCGIQ